MVQVEVNVIFDREAKMIFEINQKILQNLLFLILLISLALLDKVKNVTYLDSDAILTDISIKKAVSC